MIRKRYRTAGQFPPLRAGAWLGMFALLLYTVLPMSGMPSMQAVGGSSWMPSQLCDVSAAWQGEQAPLDGGDCNRSASACPICQVLKQFGSFLPPAVGTAATPATLSAASEFSTGQVLLSGRDSSFRWARAPPLSA